MAGSPLPEDKAIVRDAWLAYSQSGDPRDLAIAEAISLAAGHPSAVAKPRPKLKRSHAARKRKAFKRCIALDANAPIISQVRNHVR